MWLTWWDNSQPVFKVGYIREEIVSMISSQMTRMWLTWWDNSQLVFKVSYITEEMVSAILLFFSQTFFIIKTFIGKRWSMWIKHQLKITIMSMFMALLLPGPQIRVWNSIIIFFYFSTKTYVVGTRWDGSFEHPKHMFRLMDKKLIAILH